MAPAYKLTYFHAPALGEPIRFLLSYGGIDFEDNRIKRDEQWPALKPSIPFGQVPILEHNGKLANQCNAISRYVAKQVKLSGKDDWENLQIDSFVDTFNEFRDLIRRCRRECDQKLKATFKETILKESVPFYFSRFDASVRNGYLISGRLTWADLYFASYHEFFSKVLDVDVVESYPNLKKVKDNVYSIPSIKAYLNKRPSFNL